MSPVAWFGGNHLDPPKLPPCSKFLNIAEAFICNTLYPNDVRSVAHVFQLYATALCSSVRYL